MRGKFVLGMICMIGLGLVGCTNESKEVSLTEFEDKLSVNVEYIQNDEKYDLAPKFYIGNEIYAQRFTLDKEEGGVLISDEEAQKIYVDKDLYKIKGNKIEKSKEKHMAPESSENKKIGADYTLDKDGNIEELFYYNQEKGIRKTLKSLNIKSRMPFITPYEMVATNVIGGEEKVLLSLHNGDTKNTFFNVEVIDIKTKKVERINKNFDATVRWGFFKDGYYYFIDETLTLYKVKKDGMKIIEEKNLRKKFGVSTEPGYIYILRM